MITYYQKLSIDIN